MTLEQIVLKISSDPKARQTVVNALNGLEVKTEKEHVNLKSYSISDAAREMGVSRMTAFRLVKAGKLQTFETFNGRRRIPESEISRLIKSAQ